MRKSIVLFFTALLTLSISAKPAYRGPIVRTAEDGSEKLVYLHGNEHFHYMTDAVGHWLDEATLVPMSEAQKALRLRAREAAQANRAPQRQTAGDEPNLAPRGLLILVNFKDIQFSTPTDTIDSMLNGANFTRHYTYNYYTGTGTRRTKTIKSKGSARQYFRDQSYGAYNPVFDVVGPVTLSHDESYYGSNTSQYYTDTRAYLMVKEACEKADNLGVNFKLYDNDNDGVVDFIYLIYAGYGEADGGGENTIWPHSSDMTYYSYKHDGKYLGRYACGNEISMTTNQYDGIGTVCHEFSHVLGLPDFYCTSDSDDPPHTLVDWDLMDYGCYNNAGNTPPAYSAYERFYMGWITPRVLVEPEYVNLPNLNEGEGEALILSSTDTHNMIGWNPQPTNFFLLETRDKKGWDEFLPGKGMLITRIRYNRTKWQYNTVNNTPGTMGVDILEAKTNTGGLGRSTDAFPAGATQWTELEGHEITEITRSNDGIVHFSFRGAPNPEGIEEVSDQQSVVSGQKILQNGQLIIIRNGQQYDIIGNRL